jgi:hypothetical protein
MSTEVSRGSGEKEIKSILQQLEQLESENTIGISVDCVIFGFDENG